MSSRKMVKRGRFFVACYPHDSIARLAAAQEGCLVTYCQYLAYRDGYEVAGEHPDFREIQWGTMVPTYEVIFDDPDGAAPKRVRFAEVKAG